jgi:hypothetical protein
VAKKDNDITTAAERLRRTGQDPVRWLHTLADREETLLAWKERTHLDSLGPDEAARAIREAHVWCAPSVLLVVGELRADIVKRRTDEDENPNPTRRAVRYGPDADGLGLRRIADAIAEPGSDVPAAAAEQIRLNYLAFEIRRYVASRVAEGATRREALSEAGRRYHFASRGLKRPGWEAVEAFLRRRRPKKSTDVSRPAPNVGADRLPEAHPLRDPEAKEPKRCPDAARPTAPAEPDSRSTPRLSSSARTTSHDSLASPKATPARSKPATPPRPGPSRSAAPSSAISMRGSSTSATSRPRPKRRRKEPDGS